KKRFQNEEAQEDNHYTKKVLEKETEEGLGLYHQKKQLDERWLTLFQREEDSPFFVDLAEETRREEHKFGYLAEEGKELLQQKQRQLIEEAEALYEQELKLIKEEDTKDGQNGDFRSSSTDKSH